ncbi:MAG: deoxyribodipyrimidine photo-lyase, partial [Sedimenticolaceae bacterium]|nr:deoxyribodipyrimidine photo-lyase [Sedimenticolaceae bacterium]
LDDNPALQAAMQECEELIPLYICNSAEETPWAPGAASRWWLHHSLRALDDELRKCGSRLVIRQGESLVVLQQLIREEGITRLFWNRLYDPASIERDRRIKANLSESGVRCMSFNGSLLFEPWEIQTGQKTPYKVFTAFWKACLKSGLPRLEPQHAPSSLPPVPAGLDSGSLDALQLLPSIPWDSGFHDAWKPGTASARELLDSFIEDAIEKYNSDRDLPGYPGTSRLSPHLHFGEISPLQVLESVRNMTGFEESMASTGENVYIKQLGWRDFAHHLLFHFPQTAENPLDTRFRNYPWHWKEDAPELLSAWQQGRTGFPIVDAGMRELWRTGWMHNRVRMIVASLLTKNLGIHWLEGARWFWDTLVDADLANNSMGWQWTAGCGADAAPFFRIFNPVSQSERFDPQGVYIRKWVPELEKLPDKALHAPWMQKPELLSHAGIRLGDDYPFPVVDLRETRQRALDQWSRIK